MGAKIFNNNRRYFVYNHVFFPGVLAGCSGSFTLEMSCPVCDWPF